jgi:hypothetical protein
MISGKAREQAPSRGPTAASAAMNVARHGTIHRFLHGCLGLDDTPTRSAPAPTVNSLGCRPPRGSLLPRLPTDHQGLNGSRGGSGGSYRGGRHSLPRWLPVGRDSVLSVPSPVPGTDKVHLAVELCPGTDIFECLAPVLTTTSHSPKVGA